MQYWTIGDVPLSLMMMMMMSTIQMIAHTPAVAIAAIDSGIAINIHKLDHIRLSSLHIQ